MSHRTSRNGSLLLPRRQALLAGAVLGSALLTRRTAWATTVAYDYECDRTAGFIPDPNTHKRIGYITELSGFGTTPQVLAKDLQVWFLWNGSGPPTYGPMSGATTSNGLSKTSVVGVIEKLNWGGGVGDALTFDFYVSQQNATLLRSAMQAAAKNTTVSKLGWWVSNIDEETKLWYEQSFPQSPTTAKGDAPTLLVDTSGVPVAAGISTLIYKIHMSVNPAANTTTQLKVGTSSKLSSLKPWGLVVGSLVNNNK